VLPFVNLSGNNDVEYSSDGMTESLITSLSQLTTLSVKARSSVFRYKGKDVPAQQVGKELNVQAIVNGRVVQCPMGSNTAARLGDAYRGVQ
jgi:adenylate cyclase